MTEPRHLAALLLSIFAILGAYVAAYYVTVDGIFSPAVMGPQECTPYYQFRGHDLHHTFSKLFYPVQRLDVRIRDRFWIIDAFNFDQYDADLL